MSETSRILLTIDESRDSTGITKGQTSSLGSSRFRHFKWPFSSRPPKDMAENRLLPQHSFAQESSLLASLLSVSSKSRFIIVFPGFHMGLKNASYEQAKTEDWLKLPQGTYHYRGKTSAMTAFGAVKGLIAILGRIFDTDEVQQRIVFATDEQTEAMLQSGAYTHYVLLGTRSHWYSRQVLRHYSEDFEFNFDKGDWRIIDKREDKQYAVPDPSQVELPYEGMDYALIEKIIDEVSHRVIFVIGGMWDTGTLAAGQFLVEHREEIYKRFGSGGFQYLLSIPAGSTRVRDIIIERSPHRQ